MRYKQKIGVECAMAKIQEMLSVYIVLVMLVIGIYMAFFQTKAFITVNHLKREARFSRIVGYAYIVAAVCGAVFLLLV